MEEVPVKVKYNPAFQKFFSDTSFYKVLYGSAGSGKSYAIAQKIILRLLEEPGHHAWCFRKVSTYIPESVFGTLISVIEDFGVRDLVSINKTNRTIFFKNNGNKINCAGLDDEEKLKSIEKMTIAWVEETTEYEEQDVNQVGFRMRGEFPYYRELIMSFNPISELHWVKRRFFDEVTPEMRKRLYVLHTVMDDNFFLGEDYKERIREDHAHDPNNYRIYVEGKWGRIKTGQEFYKWFNVDDHVGETAYNPLLPLHISWDFNVLPYMSLTLWQIERKVGELKATRTYNEWWEVRGIEELVGTHPRNSTEDMCYYFLEKWGEKCKSGVFVYGDATGRARKTSSKKTDYMIIQQVIGHMVIEVRVPRSNPIPMEKHTFMNRMMYGSLPIRMLLHPEMKFTIQDFTHVLEDGERKKVKQAARDPVSKQVVEKFGHLSDSTDYFFMEAFKQYRV